jgi:hypothetical protein
VATIPWQNSLRKDWTTTTTTTAVVGESEETYHPRNRKEGTLVASHQILRVQYNLWQLQQEECQSCGISKPCGDGVPILQPYSLGILLHSSLYHHNHIQPPPSERCNSNTLKRLSALAIQPHKPTTNPNCENNLRECGSRSSIVGLRERSRCDVSPQSSSWPHHPQRR